MQVTLIDKNFGGINTMVKSLSLCRDKQCTKQSIKNALAAQPIPHLSVLEQTWFSFLVEGVSIKTRIQLERHRMFSTMERSTRSINMSDSTFTIPAGVVDKENYKLAYTLALASYELLIDQGESLENAAYVLPLGTHTTFTLSANGRVWYEYLNKRLCGKYVQKEHVELAKQIFIRLNTAHDELFKGCIPCLDCKTKCRHCLSC